MSEQQPESPPESVDAEDPPDPAGKPKAKSNDDVAKDAWQVYWSSLTPEQKQAFADMVKQDMTTIELANELEFDPRGSIRISRTTKKDEQGRPIFACVSPDPEIGKDVLSAMATEYTVHNRSTGSFRLVDLSDRRLLEAPGSAKEPGPDKKKEVKK